MVDFGYDISDFKAIDPLFGTVEDFESLVKAAHKLSIRVVMDWVPNHTSDEHEWFQKSLQNIEPYSDYYVWNEGKIVNGVRQPPNNWVKSQNGNFSSSLLSIHYYFQFPLGSCFWRFNVDLV